MSETDWRPISQPARRDRGRKALTVTSFTRLARTHALSTAGDAVVAASLAGTIFFAGATAEARGRVFLYLLLTMAPFAVVSPLIGPALDRLRSGRRWMVVATTAVRALMCLLMISHVDTLLLYPEAFVVLVAQKGYTVSRSALVPATVRSDTGLVEANSKLSLLSGIMSFVGAGPAGLLFALGGARWSLVLGLITFSIASVVGLKLPRAVVADEPEGAAARAELRSAKVLLAASAMGLIRGIVGFLVVLLAFDFRGEGVPAWHFPVVAVVSLGGGLVGAMLAPRLRRVAAEERILLGTLVVLALMGLLAILFGGVLGAALLGATVGIGAATGKLAFDSIVQRDAPDANRGRSFARFETRFQVIWVIGALLGLIPVPAEVGFVAVVVTATFAAFSYVLGTLAWRHRAGTERTPTTEKAAELDDHLNQVAARARSGVQRSLRGTGRRAAARLNPRRRSGSTTGPGHRGRDVGPGSGPRFPESADPAAGPVDPAAGPVAPPDDDLRPSAGSSEDVRRPQR